MSIVVLGKGFVGEATGLVLGEDPAWHDPAKGFQIRDFSPYTHAVICVPTPGIEAGLDHQAVSDCVDTLIGGGFGGVLIVRSTCEPWYLDSLVREYSSVIYWPEFLRERHASEDSLNPRQVIVGGEIGIASDWCKRLRRSGYGIGVEWTVTDVQTAAVIKLGLNSALAAKVMMFNSLHQACLRSGADWETVRSAVGNDHRIGAEQTMVPGPDGRMGFGGKCLPKDTNAFLQLVPGNAFVLGVMSQNLTVRGDDR
jgi:UDP-glucose 6-dehydrogenase